MTSVTLVTSELGLQLSSLTVAEMNEAQLLSFVNKHFCVDENNPYLSKEELNASWDVKQIQVCCPGEHLFHQDNYVANLQEYEEDLAGVRHMDLPLLGESWVCEKFKRIRYKKIIHDCDNGDYFDIIRISFESYQKMLKVHISQCQSIVDFLN